MIDINDRFNICSTIKYYNFIHIKDNIFEEKKKKNYFRLVTLKTVHPNDREFYSYDVAETLDKQYVLDGYHSYVEFGQRIIIFEQHISLQHWIQQHQLVIDINSMVFL